MNPENRKNKSWKTMNLKEKIKHVKNNITVEPVVICYIMPSVLICLATQNLNIEKACRVNLNFGEVICDALSARDTANYTEEEKKVQALVAGMQGWKTVLQSLLPCCLILFWGSYSDRHGRRKYKTINDDQNDEKFLKCKFIFQTVHVDTDFW
jgi:MFS transporter, PCFT/HCP family, solute carrier family 46, member 3